MRDRPRLAALALVLSWPALADAQPSPESGASDAAGTLAGRSACPEAAAVWAELGTLVPRERVGARLRALAAAGTPVEILDLGGSYRVLAAGRVRDYREEARDCARRARIAALFIALAVDPAWILAEPPPPPPAAAASPRPPVVETAPTAPAPAVRAPLVRLGLAAAAEAGLGAHAGTAQAGGWLRLSVGRGRWSLAAGAGLFAPLSTSVGGVSVDAWRAPLELGGRLALGGRRFERYAELGVSAALAWQRGVSLATPQTDTSVELGVAGAIGVALSRAGRAAPFAALRAEIVPDPPKLFALPRGELGTLPYFRVGVVAGAELELL